MNKIFLWLLIILYTGAGANHFISASFYLSLMPDWLPCPSFLVSVSGTCELISGIFLISSSTRRVGAWLIMAMLIVFFAVHVNTLIVYWEEPKRWLMILRFLLQFVLIYWAWIYTRKEKE